MIKINVKIPDTIKIIARDLRKNMTQSESVLWNKLRYDKIGSRFLRQKPIYVYTEDNGLDRFIIPDFYCHEKKLIIEIDGDIHNLTNVFELDRHKELLLSNLGITVLRIRNDEIYNDIEKVLQKIQNKLQ